MIKIDENVSIEYISSGLFTSNDLWIHRKRIIDSYEIVYVVKGTVYLEEENIRYTLKSGDILILEPGKIHAGFEYSSTDTSFYWVHFQVSDFDKLTKGQKLYRYDDHYKFSNLFKQLLHISNSDTYPGYCADAALLMILGEFVSSQTEISSSEANLSRNTAEWVRINSDKKLTLNDLAIHFRYSKDYISLVFRKAYKKSLKSYISEKRMQCIKNILLTSDYSLKRIADILHFEDENQLTKFFKYHENISPIKYRNTFFNTHLNNK